VSRIFAHGDDRKPERLRDQLSLLGVECRCQALPEGGVTKLLARS
jgi:hypothetical protein